jgi:hypothetical protein
LASGQVTVVPSNLVPSSPRPSKQRRAAENRAQRQALAARRENAQRDSGAPDVGTTGGTERPPRRGLLASLLGPPAGGRGAPGSARPARSAPVAPPPGDTVGRTAVLAALVLAVVGGVLFMLNGIAVDEDGDPLTREEIEAIEDEDGTYDTDPVYSAYGLTVVPLALAPAAVAAFALRGRMRPRRSRSIVIAMVIMALLTFLMGNLAVIGAMAALGVAHFQVRRADAQVAAATAPVPVDARDDVIEADVVENDTTEPDVSDAPLDDEDQRKD